MAEEVVTKQGNRLLSLLKLKQEAIDNEDYMTAKKIKDQIAKIEQSIKAVDASTGTIPDEINPQVLILKH